MRLVVDLHAAPQGLTDLHPFTPQGMQSRMGQDLVELGGHREGVVVGQLPRLLDAEDLPPVDGCGPEGRLGPAGWPRELPVVLGQEDPVQVAIGLIERLDPLQPELVVEPVLAGLPDPTSLL